MTRGLTSLLRYTYIVWLIFIFLLLDLYTHTLKRVLYICNVFLV